MRNRIPRLGAWRTSLALHVLGGVMLGAAVLHLLVADDRGVTADIDVTLQQLRGYRAQDTPLDSLTARQQEVIEAAFTNGYSDVPRSTSTAEHAADLGPPELPRILVGVAGRCLARR